MGNCMESEDLFSKEEIEEFIAKKKILAVNSNDVIEYWRKKGWKTKKGNKVKTVAAAVDCLNGIKVQETRKKSLNRAKETTKQNFLKPKHKPIRTETYNEQLKRNEWKKFREFILAVRGGKCERCGATTNLQVHHLHYISGRLAWEYLPFDVMVVCGDCHQKIHGLK